MDVFFYIDPGCALKYSVIVEDFTGKIIHRIFLLLVFLFSNNGLYSTD